MLNTTNLTLVLMFDLHESMLCLHVHTNQDKKKEIRTLVGHPEPEKNVGIFEYILTSMLIVYLDMF